MIFHKEAVDAALARMRKRIADRKKTLGRTSDVSIQTMVDQLRSRMFIRRSPGDAFWELDEVELAALEWQIEQYYHAGHFHIIDRSNNALTDAYAIIRHNHLTGEKAVTPAMFREASGRITRALLRHVMRMYRIDLSMVIMALPWRAGLAFV